MIISGEVLAQNTTRSLGPWYMTSLSGNVGIKGYYRTQENITPTFADYSTNPFLAGNILLNTRNYIWHPNFLKIDIGGEFNPGTEQQEYLVSPDRSQVLTSSKFDLRAYLFSTKPMTLSGYYNFSTSFANREYLTSIKTKNNTWGLNYSFRNKIMPITISYLDSKWDQLEKETGRTYKNNRTNLEASTRKSFGKDDDHEFRISRNTNYRVDQNDHVTDLNTINIRLNNSVFFDSRKRYSLRSSISNLNQEGNINQERFHLFERVYFVFPMKFRLSGNYNFTDTKQESQKFKNHNIQANLQHQLFSSLTSNFIYEYFNISHDAYNRNDTRLGFNFNYTKKIPTGRLFLNYSYRKQLQLQESKADFIRIIDEPHVLADGNIVLLDNPFVEEATVVVKDPTGVIIYQLNFDYFLVARDNFMEVQRVPGGQIPNNSTILVDYSADQVGSYKYVSNFDTFSARVSLFKTLLEVYYTHSKQGYSQTESTDLVTLNPFDKDLVGTRLKIKFITFGAEFDNYRALIVPYRKMRYFIQLNGKLGKKLQFNLNGNLTDMTLTETNAEQLFSDAYGKVIYRVGRAAAINVDLGYRKQIGEQIDLDLITAKAEYTTTYRKLYIKLGAEVYRRNYVGTETNFKGVYFQIDRRF